MSSSTTHPVAVVRDTTSGLRASGVFERFDCPFYGEAAAGDLVTVNVRRAARQHRLLGRSDDVRDVIATLAQHAGETTFTAKTVKAAERAGARPETAARRDLTDLPTFTIDGASTRDFDDALSARREGDSIRVWVHVADVSAFVRPGSALDAEARRRATSVYLPTLTVPMLPPALSNGACSLVPGEQRCAVTAEFLLRDGEVIERDFYRSRILSDARLTYDHVENVFLGRAERGPTYAAALAAARQAALDRTLEASEHGHEPTFDIDDAGVVRNIRVRDEQESQRLIARLMVLANTEVAQFLRSRGAPCLYRTHAAVDPEREQRMLARLASLGVHASDSAGAWDAVAEHEKVNGPSDALRALLYGARPPASYDREAQPHEGLELADYCHFTSPIRRYADLVVHRALLAELGAEEHVVTVPHAQLPDLAEHINERTRAAKKLSRRAESICRVSHLLHRQASKALGDTATGVIVGMSPHGCFIKVDCVEGLLSGRALRGAPNEHLTVWRSQGREYRLGDRLPICIRESHPARGQVTLAPVV